jgi:acylpyruvate hydrolase
MKLATIRTPAGTRAVRLDGDQHVDLGYASVGDLLAEEDWAARAAAPRAPPDTAPGGGKAPGGGAGRHVGRGGRN